jgi:hypothetical protein
LGLDQGQAPVQTNRDPGLALGIAGVFPAQFWQAGFPNGLFQDTFRRALLGKLA